MAGKNGTRGRHLSLVAAKRPTATLTRGGVAELLNISVASVRRMERSGALVPTLDAAGRHHFARRVVESLARARGARPSEEAGEVAARAFEAYARGASLVDVVCELRRPVDELRELRRVFHEEATGSLLVEPADRRELETLAGRQLKSGSEVVALVRRLVVAMRETRRAVDPS